MTDSGIEIKKVYYPLPEPTGNAVELPGTYPYTRGIQADMYRGKLWTMRQYAGFSTAEESNKRYHYLLSQGVMGLSVAFDLPTQIGFDSDHPLSEGEVGKVGVAKVAVPLTTDHIPVPTIGVLAIAFVMSVQVCRSKPASAVVGKA